MKITLRENFNATINHYKYICVAENAQIHHALSTEIDEYSNNSALSALAYIARNIKQLRIRTDLDCRFDDYCIDLLVELDGLPHASYIKITNHDLEAAKECVDICASKNMSNMLPFIQINGNGDAQYKPLSKLGKKLGIDGIENLLGKQLPSLIQKHMLEIGLENIWAIQNRLGSEIDEIISHRGVRGSLGVYYTNTEGKNYVVKIAATRKAKLEYRILEKISKSPLANIFPTAVSGSFENLGDYAFFIMENYHSKVQKGQEFNIVEQTVRNIARFHHYGKEIFTQDFVKELIKEGLLQEIDFGTPQEQRKHINYLREQNKKRKVPIARDVFDVAITQLLDSVSMMNIATEYLAEFSEWGVAHKDLIPSNTDMGLIYDLGNCAIAPLICDISRYLGQLQTLNSEFDLIWEQHFINIYRDERKHLDPAYPLLFPIDSFMIEYESAKFIDNNRLSHCCAIDEKGEEYMGPIPARAIALEQSPIYGLI